MGLYPGRAYNRDEKSVSDLMSLEPGGLITGGDYNRDFTVFHIVKFSHVTKL